MARTAFWTVFLGTTALVVGLVTPALGAARSAPGRAAHVAATAPACTTDTTDFPSDSCSVTSLTDHSVTMSWTTAPFYPYCGSTSPCIFQFFGQFALSTSGGAVDKADTVAGSCPAANQNASFHAPADGSGMVGAEGTTDYIGLFNASPLTCSITFTWDPATQIALNTAINMTELDGEAITDIPEKDHSFGVTLPTPGPHAAFTHVADKGDPGDITFTDASFSLVPHVTITHEAWTSSDGGAGTGRTWDHTFDQDGKYDVSLTVTDSSDKTDEVTHEVDVTHAGGSGSSASITVREKLAPSSDSGRFDLRVDGKTVKAKAGNKGHGVAHVKVGRHTVSQLARTVGLTNYAVSLTCTKNGKHDFTTKAWGATVKVSGGDAEVCTFTDTRSTSKHCDVPQLHGLSLAAAKKALAKAHCGVGKITKPAHPGSKLVVGHTSPAAYAVKPKGAKIGLVLV